MTQRHGAGRGRPRAVSRAMLQEAAFELFLEQGYERTTVDHIATRAGVSRATFFNYFGAKSDVFWVEVDDALDALADAFGQLPASSGSEPVGVARSALVSVASSFGSDRVPWVLTQYDSVGDTSELQWSGMSRLSRLAALLERFLVRQAGSDARDRQQPPGATNPRSIGDALDGASGTRAAAYALTGAVVAAARDWADAGTTRGPLQGYLRLALESLALSFRVSASR